MTDKFNDLAKKLRLERFDYDEIQYYKQTAINGEKIRNKKKRMCIVIQKFFRGYIVRKKVSKKLEVINNQAVVKYLLKKRKERIKKKSKELLKFYVNNYIKKQRELKRVILLDYFHYCSSQIVAMIKGFKFRKTFAPEFINYKESCQKIFNLCLFGKVNRILRCFKLQENIKDIIRLKMLINKIESNDLQEEKKLIIEKENGDSEEFFANKCNKLKIKLEKLLASAHKSFYNLYYKFYLNGKWSDLNKTESSKSNWKLALSKTLEQNEFFEVYNDFNYKEPKVRKDDDQKLEEIQSVDETKSKEEDTIVQETKEQEYQDYKDNQENQEQQEEEELDPDNRVIKSKGYNLDNLPDDAIRETSTEKRNIKKVEHLKRKAPKYDARKAIEEAKVKEKEGSSKRDDFRNMLKGIKGDTKKDEKKTTQSSVEKDVKFSKKALSPDQQLEEEMREKLKQIEGKNFSKTTEKPTTQRQPRKKEMTNKEAEKRKRLHELEKSPKKVNIGKVKSKIDCWGQENTTPTYTQKKKAIELQKAKFNPQIIVKIEQEYNNINAKLNTQGFKQAKEEKFKEFPIAYIKEESFYVKHYSADIYDQLLIHLNKHYEELKN